MMSTDEGTRITLVDDVLLSRPSYELSSGAHQKRKKIFREFFIKFSNLENASIFLLRILKIEEN